MRSIALALLFAALLVMQISLRTAGIEALLVAPVSVLLGISAAIVAQRGINWIAVASGAASSLALGWLDDWSPTIAVGLMCALWLAPRAWLSRTRSDLTVAASAAAAAATVAAVVVVRYAQASVVMHVASCVFAAAALAMATLAGRTDTPLLHAIRVSASAAEGPARELLDRAVVLMTQREDRASSMPTRTVPQSVARKIARLADQVIAQQAFQGDDAKREREVLQAQLRVAVQQLDADLPSPTIDPKPAPQATQPAQEAHAEAASGEQDVAEVTAETRPPQA